MDDHRFLVDLLLLVALAAAGVAVFERLRLPPIAAFLVMGAVVGPGGFALVDDPERVRSLAELGVILLLFEIGLELPLERLRRMWRWAVFAGGLQVALTLAGVAAGSVWLGLTWPSALVVGALVALSSTALVMGLLQQRGEIDTPQGQIVIGVLLFQDLCIVPFLLLLPVLAAGEAGAGSALALLRAGAALAVFYAVARFLIPRVLAYAARMRSSEVFTMTAFLVVIGSAVIAEWIGLTLSVGAFVGGLVLSASPYAHQLFAEVIPLRGLLLGVFFVAVGMLFDPVAAAEQAAGIAAYTATVIVLKAGLVIVIVALVLREGLRLGILAGLALAQTGEFSFVLAAEAGRIGLLEPALQQVFVAGSIVTLVATPFLVDYSPRLAARASEALEPETSGEREPALAGHVALVGFGFAGKTLARVLKARGFRYAAVEANAAAVSEAQERGEPVLYGDATRRAILEKISVGSARLVVIAISDAIATRQVAAMVRRLAPEVPIIARTRFVEHVDDLASAGASQVVAEEVESTLQMLVETLQRCGVPEESVARLAAELREEGYEFLRSPDTILDPWLVELLEEVATHWVTLPAGFSPASLADLDVRARTGATVLAVEHAGVVRSNPPADHGLQGGDRLLALGPPDAIERLEGLVGASGSVAAGKAPR
ncbi:MAG: cation:proton antiporter [Myxococcota bacterium]